MKVHRMMVRVAGMMAISLVAAATIFSTGQGGGGAVVAHGVRQPGVPGGFLAGLRMTSAGGALTQDEAGAPQRVQERRSSVPGTVSDGAYSELTSRVTANQSNFFVYLDQDSGFNHGFPSGFFNNGGPLVTIDTGCVDNPADSVIGCYPSNSTTALDETHGTVLRITFPSESNTQDTGLNIEEPQNWGTLNFNGQCGVTISCNPYDLTGAAKIEFDIRSPGGMIVQFSVGGNASTGGCGSAFMVLPASTTYTHMSLTLGPPMLLCTPDLASANVLFTVVANGELAPTGGTVLLDNIRFTPAPGRISQGAGTLSLPVGTQTFGVVPQPNNCPPTCPATNIPPDQINRNPASIYEASLTILSLLDRGQAGDLTNAQEIANALDYALAHDNQGDPIPLAPDGSPGLHNAYSDGDIGLLNDQQPPGAGKAGQVRLAGFSVPADINPAGFDLVLDGATGGNNAFAVVALLAAYKQFETMAYLNDAVTISNWIVGNLTDTTGTGFGGYYLGYPDMGAPPPKQLIKGKSTENNADIFAAFTLLSQVETSLGNTTAAAQWASNAAVAGNFVLKMFDSTKGRFNAGTFPVGMTGMCPNGTTKGNDIINICDFLDADSFTTLAMAGSQTYRNAITWTGPVNYVLTLMTAPPVMSFTQSITANGLPFSGFDLVPAPAATGIAWEFTGQMVEACGYTDAIAKGTFQTCVTNNLAQIASAQSSAPFGDKLGIVAATLNGENDQPHFPPLMECLVTPFQCIPERTGLAATNWGIYADLGINPLAFFPRALVTPTILTFATQLVGTSSRPQTVTLTNTGSMALVVTSAMTTGDFSVSSNGCTTPVATGASCTIMVAFKPTAEGTRTGTLTIKDNAPDGMQTVALTGTGTVLKLQPLSINFGPVKVGQSSVPHTVGLTNKGTTALTITRITSSFPAVFPLTLNTTNPCPLSPFTLGPGQVCTFQVTFKPAIKGAANGSASVTDNGGGGAQKVTLTGTGT